MKLVWLKKDRSASPQLGSKHEILPPDPASSLCSRVSGLAPPAKGVGAVPVGAGAAPPPPLKGLAILPKLNGVEAAAFCAGELDEPNNKFRRRLFVAHLLLDPICL